MALRDEKAAVDVAMDALDGDGEEIGIVLCRGRDTLLLRDESRPSRRRWRCPRWGGGRFAAAWCGARALPCGGLPDGRSFYVRSVCAFAKR